ncbi:putative secreted protein [Clostridium bornimense]|uniref:Putative secreted protein n=1 Tax=Clostridium bornimense TaxID=1216932 RepID=W6S6A9_9CLOT|nr:DUF4358 domain-containing protein [Clostridium bornimense]CDM69892.1 putative secreted protein [Clostridium bornimense]
MKKKILVLFLAATLGVTSLVGCAKSDVTLNNQQSTGIENSENNDGVVAEKSVEAIRKAVVDAYGDKYLATMSLSKEEINERFGLTDDMYKDAVADIPAMSTHVDTFVAVEAKEGKVNEVFDALTEYRDMLINDTMMYPMNELKTQSSEVYKYDDYVFFIMLGGYDDSLEEDSELLAYYEDQNDIAKNIIDDMLNTK